MLSPAQHQQRVDAGRASAELRKLTPLERRYQRERRAAARTPAREAREKLPVAPLAAAVQLSLMEHEMSWSRLAKIVYGARPDKPHTGDVTRLKRQLGLKPHTAGHGWRGYFATINDHWALRIARAAHIDPVEIGL